LFRSCQHTATLTLFLGAITAISLLVGGIGNMNIMLVSVRERTREIGLRKALGAREGDILAQFMIEALTISLLGGLIGLALGVLIALAVNLSGQIKAAPSLDAVSGNTITITTRNGQTSTVQLAADGKVRRQVDGQLSDVTVGAQVLAISTQSGDTFQATSIQIGGFGGGPGGGRNAQPTPTQ